MSREFFKDSYETIERKLRLADMTLELGEVIIEEWKRLETMRDLYDKKDRLIKEIAETTKELRAQSAPTIPGG